MKGFDLYRNGAIILVFLGLAFSLTADKAQFLFWLAKHRSTFADYYFYYATKLGELEGYVICGLLMWLASWKKMVTVPILGVIVLGSSYMLKSFFQHERPALYLERICYEGPMAVLDYPLLSGHHSFPSGHSMGAWALFTLVAALTKKTWVSILCLFLAFTVSISRVYLLAHFLEDVVSGALVGIALGYGVYFAYVQWIKSGYVTKPDKSA
ncbi:MAG: phosphatase PAP2 family protein [Saprospiraceae bacterium]